MYIVFELVVRWLLLPMPALKLRRVQPFTRDDSTYWARRCPVSFTARCPNARTTYICLADASYCVVRPKHGARSDFMRAACTLYICVCVRSFAHRLWLHRAQSAQNVNVRLKQFTRNQICHINVINKAQFTRRCVLMLFYSACNSHSPRLPSSPPYCGGAGVYVCVCTFCSRSIA